MAIVGKRGAGKSTIASMLSGNQTMFKAGSSSLGTTTEGADISPIIPTKEFINVLGVKLEHFLTSPNKSLPIMLIDSEGMGIKGDEFDFLVTSPLAIITKVIIYVTSENLQTDVILNDINNYMKSLEKVIFEDGQEPEKCEKPRYGHFIIVINKMMNADTTNQSILKELIGIENEAFPGASKRNLIRKKMVKCFLNVSAIGLPYLTLKPGQKFGYPALNERYRNGIASVAENIVDSSFDTHFVPVAGTLIPFNSSTAEAIVANIIQESNEGTIDFTSCRAYWNFVTIDIETHLSKASRQLEEIRCLPANSTGLRCSHCVCEFRNDFVQDTLDVVTVKIDHATGFTNINGCTKDVEEEVDQIMRKYVNTWKNNNICTEQGRVDNPNVCDSSQMHQQFKQDNDIVHVFCDNLFFCKTTTMKGKEFFIHSSR